MNIARIRINGKDDFLVSGGKDFGNLFGPGYTQQNVQVVAPANPSFPGMKVLFRNDLAPSARGEAIIEYFVSGDLVDAVTNNRDVAVLPAGITAKNIISSFTIEAFDAAGNPVPDYLGRTVITAPHYWWGARFRFKTSLRPRANTPAQLYAKRLMPPMGLKNLPGTPEAVFDYSTLKADNPMDLSWVNPAGGTTGERPDLGVTTEPGGNYLDNSDDPNAISALRATSEAAAAWPIHWRDDATDAPMNKLTFPSLNNYGWPAPSAHYQGTPDFFTGFDILNAAGDPESGETPDTAHWGSLSYLSAATFMDTFDLEEQQFAAAFVLIKNAQVFNGNAVTGTSGGARAMAWIQRTLFEAWRITKEFEQYGPLPANFMPSSYYDTILKNCVPFLEQWTKGTSRGCTVFHYMPGTGGAEPWENKFLSAVMLFGVIIGRDDYRQIGEWTAQEAINRVNGRTGAPPSFMDPYYDTVLTPQSTLRPDGSDVDKIIAPDSNWYPDQGTAFVAWALIDINGNLADPSRGQITPEMLSALRADPLNGMRSIRDDKDYVNYVRGVTALATYANSNGWVDLPDAPACLDRMNQYDLSLSATGFANAKWSFLPSVDGSLPPFAPLPAPVPLPDPAVVAATYSIVAPTLPPPPPPVIPPAPPSVIPPVITPDPPPVTPPPTGTGVPPMQFDPGSVGAVTISNPKDKDGKPDPFVTGDTLAFQILNAADQSVAADQGSFGAAVFSADNLSAVVPFTRPQATGVFLLRPTLTNVDGTPAIGTDVPFGVAVPVNDITSFDTAIS